MPRTERQLAERRSPERLLPEGHEPLAADRFGRAVVYMLVSSASFSFMAAMVKLSGDLPMPEKVMARNLVTLAITAGAFAARRENPFGPTRHLRLLILRSISGLLGVASYFYAVDHLFLADAALLNKLSPFFVLVLAAMVLGERITRRVLGGVMIAFAGAALVLKPTLGMAPLPAAAGLASSLFAAVAYVVVRALKGKESPSRIVFYFSFISTVMVAPFLLRGTSVPHGWQWLALLGTGVFAAGGQIFLTMSYHHAPAARISIYSYAHVLFSLALGLLIWRERPDVLSYVGGLLIVGAAALNRRTH